MNWDFMRRLRRKTNLAFAFWFAGYAVHGSRGLNRDGVSLQENLPVKIGASVRPAIGCAELEIAGCANGGDWDVRHLNIRAGIGFKAG